MKLLIIILFCIPFLAEGRGHSRGYSYKSHYKTSRSSYSTHRISPRSYKSSSKKSSIYCYSCSRDTSGKIARSSSAITQFKRNTGYTRGRKGYVIDHVTPLYKGGTDTPDNMQWLSVEEHKLKHRSLK